MPSVTRTTAISCIITQAFAGVTFTSSDFSVSLGEPVKLTWDASDQDGDVTILLMKTSGDGPGPVDTVTKSGRDGSFSWTPPESFESGTYVFEIRDESDDDPSFSPEFSYAADSTETSDSDSDSKHKSPSSTASETDDKKDEKNKDDEENENEKEGKEGNNNGDDDRNNDKDDDDGKSDEESSSTTTAKSATETVSVEESTTAAPIETTNAPPIASVLTMAPNLLGDDSGAAGADRRFALVAAFMGDAVAFLAVA